jgi:NADH:ubiquinone oxidoreductase subunit F (NADH-binding)
MTLTDRTSFEDYAKQARDNWQQLHGGGSWVIDVGISECSIAKGAEQTFEHLRLKLEGSGLKHSLRRVGCGGWCWAEPFVVIQGPNSPPVLYGNISSDNAPDLVAAMQRGVAVPELAIGVMEGDAPFQGVPLLSDHPFFARQNRVLFENAGVIDPYSIEEYIARDGYAAYIKTLFEMTQEEVIEEVKTANVRGRGGAGFPAGIKWESGRQARAEPKYVVCNSHEGEPNVYKDRRLIESNPHIVLEGIMIACIAVGSRRGYNYIGGEHIMAVERFRAAVAQAYELGLLGENILGTGKTLHIRTRTGGGAYICGEGSALMYSVMGERGQPRTKPPRSVEEGIWRRPTVANNTETLATIPPIIRKGGDWYASLGNEKSTGTKLVTMQGPLARLGVVEVEMGVSMRGLVFDIFGGMRPGSTFKGIQTGGVSAGPLVESQLDVPMDFDSMKPLDGMLGSGGFVVLDQHVCAVEFGRYLTAFNRYESCSKCTPCRLGNPALVEIVDRIRFGTSRPSDLDLIQRSSKHIIALSLCGLGQVAPMPLLGMINTYRDEFLAHIEQGVCPAGVCPIHARAEAAVAADG